MLYIRREGEETEMHRCTQTHRYRNWCRNEVSISSSWLLNHTFVVVCSFSANRWRNLSASVSKSARWSVENRIVSVFFVFFFIVIVNSLPVGAFTVGTMLMNSSYGHWTKYKNIYFTGSTTTSKHLNHSLPCPGDCQHGTVFGRLHLSQCLFVIWSWLLLMGGFYFVGQSVTDITAMVVVQQQQQQQQNNNKTTIRIIIIIIIIIMYIKRLKISHNVTIIQTFPSLKVARCIS